MRGFVLVGESPTVPYYGSLSSGFSYDVRNRPRKGGGLSFSFFLSFRPTSCLWIIVILTTRPRTRNLLRKPGFSAFIKREETSWWGIHTQIAVVSDRVIISDPENWGVCGCLWWVREVQLQHIMASIQVVSTPYYTGGAWLSYLSRLLQLGMGYGLRLTSGNNSTISEIISKSTESITISDTPVQTAVSENSYDQSDMRYDKTLAQQWRCCDEKRQSNHNQLPTTILTLISLPFQMNETRAERRTSGVIIRHHGKQQSQ